MLLTKFDQNLIMYVEVADCQKKKKKKKKKKDIIRKE